MADGETGRVVPARNPAALAEAIAALLDSPERCREMGRAGHRRVLERFTWNQTGASTEALYNDVLARVERPLDSRRETPTHPAFG